MYYYNNHVASSSSSDVDTIMLNMRNVVADDGMILWQCGLCQKIVKSKNHLREHIEGQHLNITYPCAECDKTLCSRGALRMHIHRNHKKIICSSD